MSSFNFSLIAPNVAIAGNTSNFNVPTPDEIGKGIVQGSDLVSRIPNGLMYALSSQISYLQENGGFWIPLKEYPVGAIVRVPVLQNGIAKIFLCRCIANSSGKDYCVETPFVGEYVANDSGNLYFQSTILNSQYWQGISNETLNIQKTSIPDFNVSYPSSQDSQLKNIQLIDLNTFTSENLLSECVFVLTIKRGGYRVDSTIKVSAYDTSNIELEVTSMKTNLPSNLAFDSSSSIFNPNSRFKDIALLGCFLSINEDKTISLNVCGKGSGASGNIEIETYLLSNSNIMPSPVEKSRSYTFLDNNSNIVIPLTEGASNKFLGVGEIIPYFGSLSFTNCFRNRLIPLNTEKSVDSFIYRGIQFNQGDNKLYSTQDRYLVQSSNSSRYISQSLPNIKGDFQCVSKTTHGEEPNANGVFSKTANQISDSYTGGGANIYKAIYSFSASMGNSIYQDGASVKPNSTKIYYFIRGW